MVYKWPVNSIELRILWCIARHIYVIFNFQSLIQIAAEMLNIILSFVQLKPNIQHMLRQINILYLYLNVMCINWWSHEKINDFAGMK